MTGMTKVLLVSSEEAHHEGVAVALATQGMQISRCALDPGVVGEAVAAHGPDVVLVGGSADRRLTADAVRAACSGAAPRPVIVLASRDAGSGARWAFEAGAVGYLLASVPLDDVVKAVRAVAENPPYPQAVRDWAASARGLESEPLLSARQREVLECVGRGLSDREIASLLSVSTSTVHREVSRLLELFGLSNRTELAAMASRLGLGG
mgnify:CR=1 FL=1